MKKNNDKYWRIGIFAFAFVLGLFASVKTGSGWIALITCVVVPLLYIPYGIYDWKRRKQDNPPEKHNKPAKTAAAEAQVKKENTSEPPQDDAVSRIEKKKDLRNTAQSEKDDGNILKSVRKIDQLEYPFRKVEYRRNISFKDIGKEYFYRDYYIKDIVTAEDGNDYVREIRASCYDGANGRPVPSCSERYTGGGIEKCYHWLFDTYYPLPDALDDAYDERFPPVSKKNEDPMKEKTFPLLGRFPVGKGDSVWMRKREGHFEMIVEHLGVSAFDTGGCSDIVPDEVIEQRSLQALKDWMNAHTTIAFHKDITAQESDYLRFLHECGVCDKAASRQKNKSAQVKGEDNHVPALSAPMWIEIGNTLEKYYLNDECSEVEIHFLKECVNFNPGGEGVDKLYRFDKTVNMFYSVYYHWDAGNPSNEHYYSREFLDPVYFRFVLQNFRADKLRSDPDDEENMHEAYRIFDHISEMLMSWLSPAEPYRRFFEKQSDDTFSVTDTDALPK